MKYLGLLVILCSINAHADVVAIDLGNPPRDSYSGIWSVKNNFITVNEHRGAIVLTILHPGGFDSMIGAVVGNRATVHSVLGGSDYSITVEFSSDILGSILINSCVSITTDCAFLQGDLESIGRVF